MNQQLFVSNFEDGKIYRLSLAGTVLSTFDPFVPDDGSAGLAPDKRPYGLSVSRDGKTLFFGTHNLDLNPELYSVALTSGDFSGSEVYHTSLSGNGQIGGGFTANPWVAIADVEVRPDGNLTIGIRTGCNGNFATSHNHGGTFYMMTANDPDGLYDDILDNPRIHYPGDTLGPDDGYGGVGFFERSDGTWDYICLLYTSPSPRD